MEDVGVGIDKVVVLSLGIFRTLVTGKRSVRVSPFRSLTGYTVRRKRMEGLRKE